ILGLNQAAPTRKSSVFKGTPYQWKEINSLIHNLNKKPQRCRIGLVGVAAATNRSWQGTSAPTE
ncbi:MAG: hypothetical protein ACE10C_01695, partial [Candidatus Binatia bacterium]